MTVKAEILVVDDEPQIRKLLRVGLTSYGYAITPVSSGHEAIVAAVRQKPDIIVLDVNLGSNLDGLAVCRELREWSATPIIMLSISNDKRTKLAALNAGADDYVTKPFDMEELEARIRVVLRRCLVEKSGNSRGELRIHDLVVDLVEHRVMLKGEEIHLTPTEYKLLTALAAYPGKVLTFRTLAEEIQGNSKNPKTEHHVRLYVNMLRKKLQDDLLNTIRPLYIFSEPEIGYRFAELRSAEDDEL